MIIEITNASDPEKQAIRNALGMIGSSDFVKTDNSYTTTQTYSANWQAISLSTTAIAGSNITLDPPNGMGNVTINAANLLNTPTVTLPQATVFSINGNNPTLSATSTGSLTLFNTTIFTTVKAFGGYYNVSESIITSTASIITIGKGTNASGLQMNIGTGTKGGNNNSITIGSEFIKFITIGGNGGTTGDQTHNYSCAATNPNNTKTVNIGTNGLAGSTTIINLGTNQNANSKVNITNTAIVSSLSAFGNILTGSLSGVGSLIDIRSPVIVCSEISTLTGLSALYGSSPGQFSAGGMLIGQNEGGAYLGRIGVRENSWQVLSGTEGVNWTSRATSRRWFGIAMSSDGRIQTAVDNTNGNIWTSYDYGVTWVSRATSQFWSDIAMSSDGRIQTAVVYNNVFNNGNISTSYDYGVTWTSRATSQRWLGIAMSSDGRIQTAVVYNNGNIWTSYDYGVTWTSRATSQNWYGIAMSSDGRIQTAVVYNNGNIWTSYDYGVTWTSRATSQNWYDIAMSTDGRIQTAVVYGGNIWTSYDYGVNWTRRATNQDWSDIAMSSDGRIQTAVVYNNGNIWTSYDYGVTWTRRATSQNWVSIAMSSDGRIQTAVVDSGNIWTSYATIVTPNPITVLGSISSKSVNTDLLSVSAITVNAGVSYASSLSAVTIIGAVSASSFTDTDYAILIKTKNISYGAKLFEITY